MTKVNTMNGIPNLKFGDKVWTDYTGKATIVRYGEDSCVLEDMDGRLTTMPTKDIMKLGVEHQDVHDLQIIANGEATHVIINGTMIHGITDIMFTHNRGSLPKLTITKVLFPGEEDDD